MSKNIFENLKGTVSIGNLKAGTLVLWNMVKDHEAEAWMAVDIAAGVGAVVTAIMATTKAVKAVEEKKTKKEEPEVDLSKKEVAETVWKYYIPTVALTALSIGGAVGSNKAHEKQYAALAALLTISETQNKDLMAKIEELFGEGSKEKVIDSITEDKLREETGAENLINPTKSKTNVYMTNDVPILTVDTFGHSWYSTVSEIRHAIELINYKFTESGIVSLDDFFDFIKPGGEISSKCSSLPQEYGWDNDNVSFNEGIRIKYEIKLDDDTPYISLSYLDMPEPVFGF